MIQFRDRRPRTVCLTSRRRKRSGFSKKGRTRYVSQSKRLRDAIRKGAPVHVGPYPPSKKGRTPGTLRKAFVLSRQDEEEGGHDRGQGPAEGRRPAEGRAVVYRPVPRVRAQRASVRGGSLSAPRSSSRRTSTGTSTRSRRATDARVPGPVLRDRGSDRDRAPVELVAGQYLAVRQRARRPAMDDEPDPATLGPSRSAGPTTA